MCVIHNYWFIIDLSVVMFVLNGWMDITVLNQNYFEENIIFYCIMSVVHWWKLCGPFIEPYSYLLRLRTLLTSTKVQVTITSSPMQDL
jgi:hypothetical protein